MRGDGGGDARQQMDEAEGVLEPALLAQQLLVVLEQECGVDGLDGLQEDGNRPSDIPSELWASFRRVWRSPLDMVGRGLGCTTLHHLSAAELLLLAEN